MNRVAQTFSPRPVTTQAHRQFRIYLASGESEAIHGRKRLCAIAQRARDVARREFMR